MRADRLLQIILLLQRHPRLSARELAERLEVSTRTVMRDMEALSLPAYRSTRSAAAMGVACCCRAIGPT